ncbi:hypothetical protein PSTG_03845 [Puccinia striiformis f. sp. tritici PST-78]|uniref:Uncharacterized protein n=1 Tax=Puccinia striiformis f. sp. tritici PST-78 TaxID=1165861 RepID=A0A0L0VUK1_9BASI|nr:hypothetical protein PSTG_03845 [Puccinia striiformis f. sp. tritici PST-78]
MRFDWMLQIFIIASSLSRAIHGAPAIGDDIGAVASQLKQPGESWSHLHMDSSEGNHLGLDVNLMQEIDQKVIDSNGGNGNEREHRHINGSNTLESSKGSVMHMDQDLQHSAEIESTARRRITKQTEANREHREEEVANHSILMQSQTQKEKGESNSIFDQAHGLVALPSSSLTHKMLEVQRKAAIEVVEECQRQTNIDVAQWHHDFSQLSMDEEEKLEMQKHLDVVRNAMDNLFEKRIHQLRNKPYVFQASSGVVNGDVANKVFELAEKDWLEDVTNLEIVGKVLAKYTTGDPKLLLIRWCDLMTKFIVDLKHHQLITSYSLDSFLNEYDHGHFILDYVKMVVLPYSTDNVFLNFNLELSLQENLSGTSMATILRCLDQETWRQIEFDYVISCVEKYQERVRQPNLTFNQISEIFSRLRASRDDSQKSIEIKIDDFFEQLVNYISSRITSKLDTRERMNDLMLLELKILYDMLSYMMNYHVRDISTECMKNFKGSINFVRVLLFEETVGLVASLYHTAHVTVKEAYHILTSNDEAMKTNEGLEAAEYLEYNSIKLTDSNQHRRVSNFSGKDEKRTTDYKHLSDPPIKAPCRYWTDPPHGVDPSPLHDAIASSENVQKSIFKTQLQYRRYFNHLKKRNVGKSSVAVKAWEFVEEELLWNGTQISKIISPSR